MLLHRRKPVLFLFFCSHDQCWRDKISIRHVRYLRMREIITRGEWVWFLLFMFCYSSFASKCPRIAARIRAVFVTLGRFSSIVGGPDRMKINPGVSKSLNSFKRSVYVKPLRATFSAMRFVITPSPVGL